jgi:fibronectin type 3 domain-containing protein
LSANNQYCYAVASLDSAGNESAKSSPSVCATTPSAGPPTPTNLTATESAGPPPKITLTWTTSLGATSYRIYRNGTLLLSATGAQATDTTVAAQTNYCYAISAVDASGKESAQSDSKCVSTSSPEPPAPPEPPTGLTATVPVPAPLRVNLIWNTSTGAVSYRIYRNGTLVLSPTAAPATDAAVVAGTLYCYTISAVDALGIESAQSVTPVCVTP